ncbi:SCO family protein [Chloroflexus sp.]|uniref:SCO family protein n=1 Tax=Chloroflexus sp. TaxID=1904827 RepID=UPI00404AD194
MSTLLAGLLATLIWFVVARPVKVLPRGEPFPPFALTDQRGTRLLDSDMRGRMVFVNLMHRRCGDECAEQTRRLLELRQVLQRGGRLGSEVLFLTITLDLLTIHRPTLQHWRVSWGWIRKAGGLSPAIHGK